MEIESFVKLKNDFNRDGYLYMPGFFNADEVNELNKNVDDFVRYTVPQMGASQVMYEDSQDVSTLKQMQDIHVYSPFFNTLMTDSKVKLLAEIVLGEEAIGKNVEYFNKPPRIGKGTPPHQDAYYFNIKPAQAVTLWIALEAADVNNGCVSYITGSHLKSMRPHGRTTTLGFSQSITDYGTDEDNSMLQTFPAKAGDLLIHHSMTIHLAGANTSDCSRKALGLIYFGASAKPDLDTKAAYMAALQSLT